MKIRESHTRKDEVGWTRDVIDEVTVGNIGRGQMVCIYCTDTDKGFGNWCGKGMKVYDGGDRGKRV